MMLFRPNEHVSRDMIMRRAKSIGEDLSELRIEDVDTRVAGRVMENEYEWRQL